MKIAYLTIDDAPTRDFRAKVDILLDKGIPAIFFCRGDLLEKNREEAILALKKGFILGNHAYSHPHFSEISVEECKEQIQKTDAILAEIYAEVGIAWKHKLFRFPYGDKGGEKHEELQAFLQELGYAQPTFAGITYDWFNQSNLATDADMLWTFDVKEWCLTGAYEPELRSIEAIYRRWIRKTLIR